MEAPKSIDVKLSSGIESLCNLFIGLQVDKSKWSSPPSSGLKLGLGA